MSFLYDNAATISVAAVCCTFAWVFGGTVPSALMPAMPWLLAFMLEMCLCFPQRHAGESTPEARARVWSHMKRDPMTWVVALFLVLLLVPFFNKGLCPTCDYPEIHFDGIDPAPPIPFAPFCVNRLEHLTVCMWFFPTLIGALVVRHALLKRGKRTLLEMVVWNGVLLAVLGIVQQLTGAKGPLWTEMRRPTYFFSTFGYPNMAADYFTTLFGISVALWRWKVFVVDNKWRDAGHDSREKPNRKIFWSKHALLIPAVLFFFSAMMTLSRSAIVFCSLLAVVFYFHSLTSFISKKSKSRRVKAVAANVLVILLLATFFAVFLTNRDKLEDKTMQSSSSDLREDFKNEASNVGGRGMIDRMAGLENRHIPVAMKVALDNPFFGCGGWGYRHFSLDKMSDASFRQRQTVGGANVHNDYLQFIVEHGAVGFLLLFTVFAMFLWPVLRIWKAIIISVRFMKPKDRPPRPVAIFALPASAFCVLLTVLATLVHAFGDCPLRSPAILSLFFVSMACVDGFLPRLRQQQN